MARLAVPVRHGLSYAVNRKPSFSCPSGKVDALPCPNGGAERCQARSHVMRTATDRVETLPNLESRPFPPSATSPDRAEDWHVVVKGC